MKYFNTLLSILVFVLVLSGCALIDQALLEPKMDPDTKEQVYEDLNTGEEKTESELTPEERDGDDWAPVYTGPKDLNIPNDLPYVGGLGAALVTILGGLYYMIRKRKKKQYKSPEPLENETDVEP